MMDGNPLSPNESLLPKKKPGRSIFIGHKMSLHLITEDMIEETDSEQEEEEEEKIAENYQAPPPGLFSPPGIGSTENTSTSKGNEEVPQGLGVAQKLEDVKEGEDEVGIEDMPSLGVDTKKTKPREWMEGQITTLWYPNRTNLSPVKI